MQIETAFRQYTIRLRETTAGDELELALVALEHLQEYLAREAQQDLAERIGAEELGDFVRQWYRSEAEPSAEAAEGLIQTVLNWVEWLDSYVLIPAGRQPVVSSLAWLEEELPRAARAAGELRGYVHRDDLGAAIPVSESEEDAAVALLTAGASRLMRPDEIDYGQAEEDTYEIVTVGVAEISLRSRAREQFGQGTATPVVLPARVTRWLRPGDTLHVEIAPAGRGWEILNVVTVYPGGWDDRP